MPLPGDADPGDGGAKRAAERLERGLGQVVIVASAAPHVERDPGRPGERLEGVLDELEAELAGPLAAERQVDDGVRPPAHVDDGRRQRLVHRHGRIPEAFDPGPLAERLGDGRAEHQRDVLDGVVVVDVEVADRANGQVEQAVVGERAQQVIVEPDAGRDVGDPAAVEVELDRHLRLAGGPGNGHPPVHAIADVDHAERGRHAGSPRSRRAAAVSRSLPARSRMVSRRQWARG